MRKPQLAVNPPVFFVSGGLLIAFIAFGVLFTERANVLFGALLSGVSTYFGWLYVIAVAFFILFCAWLLVSPYARIRLGDDDDRPEFHTLTWFSMLFSAGMGIGLVFFGVAEPISHFNTTPQELVGTPQAAARAMSVTFFHWGLHAWAIYVLMGLGIAYFSFRKKLPLAIRSCFYPLLGDRIHGPVGHVIDILAVCGTLFGLATSLGLGAKQISGGLSFLFDTPHDVSTQLILIGVITLCATVSLVTGVDKGIRRLSELNMLLAALLMLFVLAVGPTLYVINSLVENVGRYLASLVPRTFYLAAFDQARLGAEAGVQARESAIVSDWTLFYWGWWIAWSPFVGMFVARISRGRTIREFVLGVLLVPTAVTFLWLSVFGSTALHSELFGAGGIAEAVAKPHGADTAIYLMLEQLPLARVTSLLAAAVVAVFFVTSSDSASFVVDMITSGGNPDPPVWQRVFWALAEGACAAVLLYAGGEAALSALQAAVVSAGLPFCVVLLGMSVSITIALRGERLPVRVVGPAPSKAQVATGDAPEHSEQQWRSQEASARDASRRY